MQPLISRSMQVAHLTRSEASHTYPGAGALVSNIASSLGLHVCAVAKVQQRVGRKQACLSASSVGAAVTSALVSLRFARVRRSRFARAIGASQLAELDPELAAILRHERERQIKSVNLIASENFAAPEVFEVLASELNNKYSEGVPGARYYAGK